MNPGILAAQNAGLSLIAEVITCSSCKARGQRQVLELEQLDGEWGPWTWIRISPGWFGLGDDRTYRCPNCLLFGERKIQWSEKPLIRSGKVSAKRLSKKVVAAVGSSVSRSPTERKKPSSPKRKPRA